MSITKKELRAYYKKIRATMSEKRKKDIEILNRLKASEVYNYMMDFFVYVSSPIEVDTRMLINTLLSEGKRVAVPVSNPENCTMKFYYIKSLDELKEGTYGILEPVANESTLAKFSSETVCIVPGLSFDKNGFRLGFGKGYYDRFLSCFSGISIGLCYEQCMSEEMIHDPYDQKVQYVVTDKKIYKVK